MINTTMLRKVFAAGTPLEQVAVDGISLDVADGEFVTVVGSNGSGKSTLLNLIAGDFIPNSGKINLANSDMTARPSWQRAKLLGRVFQDPLGGTCAHLTVEENLALAARRARTRGWALAVTSKRRTNIQQRLAELGMGLESRLGDPVGLLSGGQRQALSLVMATLAGSRILLLDEHTAALDPQMSATVLELTAAIAAAQKLCVLMVTHSMAEALAVGSRTIMMHRGKIVLDIGGQEHTDMTPEQLLAAFRASHPTAAADTKLATAH